MVGQSDEELNALEQVAAPASNMLARLAEVRAVGPRRAAVARPLCFLFFSFFWMPSENIMNNTLLRQQKCVQNCAIFLFSPRYPSLFASYMTRGP
jgi:hypothetical protein